MKNNFIYFASANMTVSDTESMSQSERTFDINVFDLANNEGILNLLNLYYMRGNYGAKYTHQTRAEWFCGYLSAFGGGDTIGERCKKLLTNPVVRIVVTDSEKLNKIKELLNGKSKNV